ncbi:thioredoxin domain-containing protein 16 isoform X2 [Hemicordylus capensis]|uniref:thioredoxin domain-containing protein 16 isoform X2 n=1 Tax=Hemicordylus capensis TaxID=884348 RepID=UPI002302D9CB|nr:thioredoxin domain-containing protein 16 isoform X2 [Hemicordylus capensis]
MSSLQTDGWTRPFTLLLLLCASCVSAASSAEDAFLELDAQEYFSSLQASQASLVYFRRDFSPSSEVFLEQLEHSVEGLRDYGISVLKVNCQRGEASSYCKEDSSLGKAYLFSALLFHEVKYIKTLEDLQNLEDTLKGQSDLVFAYVQAVGTAEHRVFMEAAFVYGSLKFALTTEVAVLRSICNEESDVPSSKLFFCHSKGAADPAQPCRRTLMEQPLTTLSVHRFLKLMAEPLVVEVAEDPETVSTPHFQLGLPLIFILTRKETLEADKRVAEFVAWRLLGKAGVVLLARSSVGLDIPLRSNVAFKTTEEGVPVQYLALKDMDEIVALVEKGKQSDPTGGYEEEQEQEEEEDDESYEQEFQDDQVVESVIRDRKRELPLEHIQTLSEESFRPALAKANHTVVLFYASWEAVSQVVMQSYVEVAARLKGTPEVSLGRVNCWDWPQLCTRHNVTQFPAIRMYRRGGRWSAYAGMWGVEELLRFIALSKASCPLRLTTPEEVEEYFSGKASPSHHVSVLGIFDSSMREERDAFAEAGSVLSGEAKTGIYSEDDAAALARKYNVPLPALLLARPESQRRRSAHLSKWSVQDIVEVIRRASLEIFPEITVGNLPGYLQLEKPLLVLFSNGALSKRDEGEMRLLAKDEHHETFIACWLNLKNTPVGRGILKAYFGSPLPPLPLLVWVSRHFEGQVFVFPSDQPITEANLRAWIKNLKSGLEVPSTTLSVEDWKPHLPAYDFLSLMEPTLPEFTIYSQESVSAHQEEMEVLGGKKATAMREEPAGSSFVAEQEKKQPTGGDLRGTVPRLAAREKQAKRHAEL